MYRIVIDNTGATLDCETIDTEWIAAQTGLAVGDVMESGHWSGDTFHGGYEEDDTCFSIEAVSTIE